MRVLWLANNPSNYSFDGKPFNGKGWVSALESEISGKVDLALGFLTPSRPANQYGQSGLLLSWGKEIQHGVCYYPIYNGYDKTKGRRLSLAMLGENKMILALQESFRAIVEDFKPDVIQVFGSEGPFGLVAEHTDVPVILHIQGIAKPYYENFLPPKVSWTKYVLSPSAPGGMIDKFHTQMKWKRAGERENRIFKAIKYYLGRTDWDHKQVRSVNPDAEFFYGGEILRQPFYDADIDAISDIPSSLKIVSTVSDPPYKGYDLILRTAKTLKEKYMLPFEWKVFGNVAPKFFEKITGIKTEDVGVTLAGVATADQLVDAMGHASMYIHPSYIDNSPNSVCEAQLLGAAVVATSVGGVPSLIEDGQTGFLVRKGNHEEMAERIVAMYRNKELLRRVGRQARAVALERHDRAKIASDLIEIYRKIVRI